MTKVFKLNYPLLRMPKNDISATGATKERGRLLMFLAKQKFRFDAGQGAMAILNFAFITLAASDKIASYIHIPARILIPILVPFSIFLVWFIGFILDKAQFNHAYMDEYNDRNDMLKRVSKSEN